MSMTIFMIIIWFDFDPFERAGSWKLDNLFCLYSIDLQPLPSVRDNRLNFTFVPINWHNVQVRQKNFTNDRYLSGSSEQRFHKNNIFCSVTDTDTVRQTKILSKAKNQNKIHVVSFPWSIKPIMQQITHLHQISQSVSANVRKHDFQLAITCTINIKATLRRLSSSISWTFDWFYFSMWYFTFLGLSQHLVYPITVLLRGALRLAKCISSKNQVLKCVGMRMKIFAIKTLWNYIIQIPKDFYFPWLWVVWHERKNSHFKHLELWIVLVRDSK